jgi:hypothetical protein
VGLRYNDLLSIGNFFFLTTRFNVGLVGLEFDPNPCADGWVVWHDATMQRLTRGEDERRIIEVPLA